MFDQRKRTTLKTMAAGTAAITLPTLVGASPPALPGQLGQTGAAAVTDAGTADVTVHFATRTVDGRQQVLIRNRSASETTLRHVYPGRVTVDGQVFDLNEALIDGPLTLAANRTRRVTLVASARHGSERSLPRGLSASRALRVSSLDRRPSGLTPVTTTRSLFV